MEISVPIELLLITADDSLLDQALAVCAAAGVEPEVVADAGAARAHWVQAGLVMIGEDQAQSLVALGLPGRAHVLLLAAEPDHELAGHVAPSRRADRRAAGGRLGARRRGVRCARAGRPGVAGSWRSWVDRAG